MDATASDKHQAQPALDAASTTSSVPEMRRVPLLSESAVAGSSGAAEESAGVGSEDEQVERFYALLENIRVLRNVYGATAGSSRKRARGAEPPWRPRFRMEDFREVDDKVSVKKEWGNRVERHRPDSDDDAADHDGEVVEENDRVSASRSARACTDSA